ncbi:carboxypeptidase-like regulatory domain-containing protein [Roseivirga sp. BDSF3-8]|uniref:TonB-dependent receptor n=1 Tax=Roseivirga sp. BDSF3-8 TaxID=3241598 RepID=UPI0035320918
MGRLYSFLLITCFTLVATMAAGQGSGKLSGYVRDMRTGEPLPGATVQIDGSSKGGVANAEGYYEASAIAPGTYSITASFVGYKQRTRYNIVVRSAGATPLNFELEEATETLEDVVVVASPFETSPETPLSIQSLSPEEIATYPGGNNDIAKVVQSLPGVSGSVGGFRNDVIIRGGAPNENVYYLDGVEIPNINHFSTQGSAGGPVGLLNVSFIEGVTLSSSAFHSRYDNPLSGVLQFDQRVGNRREFQGNVRISASEAALTLEGPVLKKDKEASNTSYIVSVRRSYLQLLFQLLELPILPDYWDYQYKVTHKLDDYNEINLIGVGSIDDFSVQAPDDYDPEQQATLDQVPVINQWSTTAGISWKKRFRNESGFMTTVLSTNVLNNDFSQYEDNEDETGLYFRNDSRETERKLRYEYTHFAGDWTLAGGLTLQQALYENNTLNAVNNITYNSDIDFYKYGFFFQSSRAFLNERLDFSFGLRTDANTFTTTENQLLKHLSPRVALSYALDPEERWKLNASVGRYYKLPPYTVLGFKNNTGVLTNKEAEYIRSDHYVAGLEYLLGPSTRITLEGFLKRYSNYPVSVLDSVSLANKGADFEVLGNEEVRSVGEGRTYGVELLFQQKLSKRFYGILALTFFTSEFTAFDDEYLPSVWNSGQLATFTGGYKFGKNWEASLRYRYIGNTPYAPVNQSATLSNYPAVILDYTRLGEVELSSFNQADIRIDKKWNFTNLSLDVYFELQNAFGQQAPQPPSFGLNRNEQTGEIIEPRELVEIETDASAPLPIIGFVIDF